MPKVVEKKAPRNKKGANGYKLPEPIPKGTILTDLKKEQWILGSSIGVGGFGEIYCAAPYKGKTPSDYPQVVKIEPHGNGPLFVEMHFYMRNASAADIEKWKKDKRLPELGMPRFLGNGSHELKGTKYRFVVMDRFGIDLWKLFLENDRIFPEHTVYKVAWQIINVLEYIHNKGYVHADIKGGNLLLDLKNQNQVFMVDFGLASKCTSIKEYKLDPKKAHNGTIEYTSRDAHMGVPTMRGDIEILAYNIIQWLCGKLPWENNLKDPSYVQSQKEKAFSNVQKFLNDCFGKLEVPETVINFMTLLSGMKFSDVPNYDKFRDILEKGLKKLNHSTSGKLDFSKKSSKVSLTPSKRAKINDDESRTPAKKKAPVARTPQTPRTPKNKNTPAPSANDSLNASIDSIVIDEKCMAGKDIRKKILANLDADAEYEIQIKKRKTRTPSKTPASVKVPTKRARKKIEVLDSSQSEPEEVLSKGTKSRPALKPLRPTRSSKRSSGIAEYDSEKDIFDDSFK